MTDMSRAKTQKEQIMEFIEEYIDKFVKYEVTLTAGEISKWPVVDKICKNTNAPNICNAMKAVSKYQSKQIDGVEGSTSFKMHYTKARI